MPPDFETEVTDYLVCGGCQKNFKLANITTFVNHKKFDCDDQNTLQGRRSKILCCKSCPQRFSTPWSLLQHAQNVHALQIYLEKGDYSDAAVSSLFPVQNSSSVSSSSIYRAQTSYMFTSTDAAAKPTPVVILKEAGKENIALQRPPETTRIPTTTNLLSTPLAVPKTDPELRQIIPKTAVILAAASTVKDSIVPVSRIPQDAAVSRSGAEVAGSRTVAAIPQQLIKSAQPTQLGKSNPLLLKTSTNLVSLQSASTSAPQKAIVEGTSPCKTPLQQALISPDLSIMSHIDENSTCTTETSFDNSMEVTGEDDSTVEGGDLSLNVSKDSKDEKEGEEAKKEEEEEPLCCDDQACGVTLMPVTHEELKKCCSAVLPKKRKRHMATNHMPSSLRAKRRGAGGDKYSVNVPSASKSFVIDIEHQQDSPRDSPTKQMQETVSKSEDKEHSEQLSEEPDGIKRERSVIIQPGSSIAIPVSLESFKRMVGARGNRKGKIPILFPRSFPMPISVHVTPSNSSRSGSGGGGSRNGNEVSMGGGSSSGACGGEEEEELGKLEEKHIIDQEGEAAGIGGEGREEEKQEKGGRKGKRRYPTSKPFKCGQCEKGFNQRIHLQKHQSKHTGIKPFQCGQCSYSTVEKSHLKVHIRVHTGEKPFKCTYCEYATAQNSTLRIHLRRHHEHGTCGGELMLLDEGETNTTTMEESPENLAILNQIIGNQSIVQDLGNQCAHNVENQLTGTHIITAATNHSLMNQQHPAAAIDNQVVGSQIMEDIIGNVSNLPLANQSIDEKVETLHFGCQICHLLLSSQVELTKHMQQHKGSNA